MNGDAAQASPLILVIDDSHIPLVFKIVSLPFALSEAEGLTTYSARYISFHDSVWAAAHDGSPLKSSSDDISQQPARELGPLC